jgi:hypothetical protein
MIRIILSSQSLEIKLRATLYDPDFEQFRYDVKHFGMTTNATTSTLPYHSGFVADNQLDFRLLISGIIC